MPTGLPGAPGRLAELGAARGLPEPDFFDAALARFVADLVVEPFRDFGGAGLRRGANLDVAALALTTFLVLTRTVAFLILERADFGVTPFPGTFRPCQPCLRACSLEPTLERGHLGTDGHQRQARNHIHHNASAVPEARPPQPVLPLPSAAVQA